MAVSVGVTIGEVEQLAEALVVLHVEPLSHAAVGHTVEREHVDIDTAQIAQVGMLDERGACVLQLGERLRIVRVVLCTHQFVAFGQPFRAVRDEFVVVAMRHAHICVVVPWYEAFVAYGTQLCASGYEIAQVVLFARLVDGL